MSARSLSSRRRNVRALTKQTMASCSSLPCNVDPYKIFPDERTRPVAPVRETVMPRSSSWTKLPSAKYGFSWCPATVTAERSVQVPHQAYAPVTAEAVSVVCTAVSLNEKKEKFMLNVPVVQKEIKYEKPRIRNSEELRSLWGRFGQGLLMRNTSVLAVCKQARRAWTRRLREELILSAKAARLVSNHHLAPRLRAAEKENEGLRVEIVRLRYELEKAKAEKLGSKVQEKAISPGEESTSSTRSCEAI